MKNKNDTSFFENLEKTYFELALTELAMDYYVLKEKDLEKDGNNKDYYSDIRKDTENLAKSCFLDFEALTENGQKAWELRSRIKERVEILVKKIDRLELDSYVSKRDEVSGEKFDYPDDDEAARVVLRSIFSVNDNAIINEKIKTAVYELPVRMTKNRFFDILKNGLKLYIGSGKDILERAIYMLESTSGISGDGITDKEFENRDIEDIREEYEYLNELAGICNYICVLGNCSSKIRSDEKENAGKLLELIKLSSELDLKNAEEAEKILSMLEGKLENLSERLIVLEAKLSGFLESENDTDGTAGKLENMRRLMSSSVYADLGNTDSQEAVAEDVEKAYEEFSGRFGEVLKGGDRRLNRARMAACLSALPVFFNSRTEVMNYVRESLASCSNIHEKNIAVSNIIAFDT